MTLVVPLPFIFSLIVNLPAEKCCEEKQSQHFRTVIAHEYVADDGRSDGCVTRLPYSAETYQSSIEYQTHSLLSKTQYVQMNTSECNQRIEGIHECPSEGQRGPDENASCHDNSVHYNRSSMKIINT